jgi:hypothetical protein
MEVTVGAKYLSAYLAEIWGERAGAVVGGAKDQALECSGEVGSGIDWWGLSFGVTVGAVGARGSIRCA